MQDLGSLLPGMLKSLPDSDEVRQALVFGAWRKAAGESLGNHSAPVELTGKTLRIFVSGERWEEHLKEIAPKLIFKINNIFREETVTRLEFEAREEHFADEHERINSNTLAAELDEKLAKEIGSIEDSNLRKAVRKAAGAYLRKQEKDGR